MSKNDDITIQKAYTSEGIIWQNNTGNIKQGETSEKKTILEATGVREKSDKTNLGTTSEGVSDKLILRTTSETNLLLKKNKKKKHTHTQHKPQEKMAAIYEGSKRVCEWKLRHKQLTCTNIHCLDELITEIAVLLF